MDAVEIFSIISTMKVQEKRYLSKDYLHDFRDQVEYRHRITCELDPSKPVDKEFRFCMVGWCYKIVDFCKFNRDTVAISVNYLDRFLSSVEGMTAMKDRKQFKLAAITCLYTAIKTHEVEAIDLSFISELSKGIYTEEQVCVMERKIIMALQWRLNPPTPCSFTRYFLTLIPNRTMSKNEKSVAMQLVKYQTESAVGEYNFLSYDASCIALASLANAIQATKRGYIQHILLTISMIADIDIESQVFMNCRDSLLITLNKTHYHHQSKATQKSSKVNTNKRPKVAVQYSPRGVNTFPNSIATKFILS
mmetsp:Transcript_40697/g.46250  ORF Transcript_40697/g.46250 Transcript_40697/m.46250 type:complete len:306 (+) Transcript_40697:3-920(+)